MQKVAAQTQLTQQQALGGAAVAQQPQGAPMEGEPLPPEVEAMLMEAAMAEAGGAPPEESLAAGGPAPIREGA